jgi:hypothetical protein
VSGLIEKKGKSMSKGPPSRVTINKPGDRIVLDPSIPQTENVFDLLTYKDALKRAKQLLGEMRRLNQVILSYPEKQRPDLAERTQSHDVWKQFRRLTQEYRSRLPIHKLARCPYCGTDILRPVDSFSLMGFDPDLDATELYGGEPEWPSPPPRQHCRHALGATLSVNLNGLQPDDLRDWMLWDKTLFMRSAPYFMVWPLIARYTSAVVHALPIGRLDDEEPIHRYTAYFTTYFAGDRTNLRTREMWVPNDVGGPAMGAVQTDADLLKWVRAGRLYWLDPDDTSRLVAGPPEAFPYANIQPNGWYYILEGGQLDGPHSYRQVWQGDAPRHDESFPKTIE